MAEEQKQEHQDSSKTLVAFTVGLLIGGMLVWAFSGPSDDTNSHLDVEDNVEEITDESDVEASNTDPVDTVDATATAAPQLKVGDGSITVTNQAAGNVVTLERAVYPIDEGWIGVRDYNNGQLSFIKGVVRFSAAADLVPESIPLIDGGQTMPGRQYAVVIFTEDGDNTFNPAGDVQLDEIFATFTAE